MGRIDTTYGKGRQVAEKYNRIPPRVGGNGRDRLELEPDNQARLRNRYWGKVLLGAAVSGADAALTRYFEGQSREGLVLAEGNKLAKSIEEDVGVPYELFSFGVSAAILAVGWLAHRDRLRGARDPEKYSPESRVAYEVEREKLEQQRQDKKLSRRKFDRSIRKLKKKNRGKVFFEDEPTLGENVANTHNFARTAVAAGWLWIGELRHSIQVEGKSVGDYLNQIYTSFFY